MAQSLGTPSQHRIVLEGRSVDYRLRFSARRTVGMRVDGQGLWVGAPRRMGLAQVEAALARHGAWVLRKLDEWALRPATPVPTAIADGMSLPLLGQPWRLSLAPGANRVHFEAPGILLRPRAGSDAAALLRRGLRREAMALLSARVAHHAAAMGCSPASLRLSQARTRWGSCNARGAIRLNWRLIHLPLALVDYVVIHELAHLVELNHSPRFWAVVAQACPPWRERRAELKVAAATVPVI
ncbi:MAG: M48 family metallopeptidase [Betaproteobacteria bacterium]|nr:M48 family metallopeptidase [Betaproteobacteria bacterium]